MVGLAGEGQNFDGNGPYVRFQPGGGAQTISTGKYGGSAGDTLFGNAIGPPLGTRPEVPVASGRRTTRHACYKNQKLPDLNGPAARSAPAARPCAAGVGHAADANAHEVRARAAADLRPRRAASPQQPSKTSDSSPPTERPAQGRDAMRRDPQALRDFVGRHRADPASRWSSAATSSPTSASTCPTGCRSSAPTSSRSRPSSPPRRRSRRARARRSTSPACRSARSRRSSSRTAARW